MDLQLRGKRVIVTGGNRGMGQFVRQRGVPFRWRQGPFDQDHALFAGIHAASASPSMHGPVEQVAG